MSTLSAEILWADLKTKTTPVEFIDCLLNGLTVGEIRCYSNETLTNDIVSEKISKGLPFQIHSLNEKEIQWTSLQQYQHELSSLYADLINDFLKNDEDAPASIYAEVKEIESRLKLNQLKYDTNSRINFSTDFSFTIMLPDLIQKGFPISYNQLELADEASHYLHDIFKVRHELIYDMLQTTEQAMIKLEAEKNKTYRFKIIDSTNGGMLLSEFVVALTDEKKGLLQLGKKEKHALVKQMYELFGLSYTKWLEYDVLCRDNPSKHLETLCDILAEKKYRKVP